MRNIATLIQTGINTVAVRFHPNEEKTYLYKTNLSFEIGDFAIVQIQASKVFKVVEVVEVHKGIAPEVFEADYNLAWIVQKVDTDTFNTLVQNDTAINDQLVALEAAEHRNRIMTSLKENLNPDAVALLEQLGTEVTSSK